MANGHGDHHHIHHEGHDGAVGHTGASTPDHAHRTAPPIEPGYPQHPELAHPPGELPGAEGHAAHARHDTHAGHGAGGHDRHAGHSVEMFRHKFWISLLLTIPTLIWGHMVPRLTGWHPPMFPGAQWIAPVFGTAVFVYGGWVFLQGAARELKDRLPGMMTLTALAITMAFGFSLAVTLGFRGTPLWEELATLVTIMLLGHWLEMQSIFQAQGALQELAKLLPSTAVRLVGDRMEEVLSFR